MGSEEVRWSGLFDGPACPFSGLRGHDWREGYESGACRQPARGGAAGEQEGRGASPWREGQQAGGHEACGLSDLWVTLVEVLNGGKAGAYLRPCRG